MFEKLLQRADVARMTGLALDTVRNYATAGLLPPPRMRVGNVTLYAKEDIAFFMKTHRGRKTRRKRK